MAAPAQTIHDAVFAHAVTRPHDAFATIVRDGQEATLTFGELAEQARAFAGACRARGIEAGQCVALMLPLSPQVFPAFLGAMALGAIPAFFPRISHKQDPGLFWQAHDAVFRRMPARLLVIAAGDEAELARRLPAHRDIAVAVEDLARERAPAAPAPRSGDDIAFLQHSSGTTGLKKGVALSHRAVLTHIAAYAAALELRADDRIASWLPLYHDMGLIACFMLPAVRGLQVVCLDPFEWVLGPWSLLDAIDRHGCSLCWLPNFAFQHIVRTLRPDARHDLRRMRAFIDCSEPCKPTTLESFYGAFSGMGLRREALQVCYAMAENVFAVTQTPLHSRPRVVRADREVFLSERRVVDATDGRDAVEFLSCGSPIATAQVMIADGTGAPLPADHVGRIVIGGSTLFDGYHGGYAPDAVQDGWYQSGDLGFMRKGELYVTGRADDLLILNGQNVYAHDIEHALAVHGGFKPGRAVALGVFNPTTASQELVVVVESPAAADHAALRRRIGQVVESEVGVGVKSVRFVEPGWLLKTTSGKISRGANLEKYLADLDRTPPGA